MSRPAPARRPAAALVLMLTMALALALAACSRPPARTAALSPPVTGVRDVVAKDLRFRPDNIQVPAGTTVTWHFEDGRIPHNVKLKGSSTGSPNLTSGTFTHRFDAPGTYEYFCSLHGRMVGRVVVVAG